MVRKTNTQIGIFEWLEEYVNQLSDSMEKRLRHAESQATNRGKGVIYALNTHILSKDSAALSRVLRQLTTYGHSVVELISRGDLSEGHSLLPGLLDEYRLSKRYSAFLVPADEACVGIAVVTIPSYGSVIGTASGEGISNLFTVMDSLGQDQLTSFLEYKRDRSTLLLNIVSQDTIDWEYLTRSIEELPGDRLQARELFTTLSEPLALTELEFRSGGLGDDGVAECIRLHSGRVSTFRDQVELYRFMNIAHAASVLRYINSGLRERMQVLVPPQIVLEHVRNEIDLLRSLPNYHLALVDEEPQLAFMIKGDRVLFEIIRPKGGADDLLAGELMVQSEGLSSAFRVHFEELWKSAGQLTRKDNVISFLEKAISVSPYLAKIN